MKIFWMTVLVLIGVTMYGAEPGTKEFQVESGDVRIELSERFFWNLNGIWYQGELLCRQNKGFYGTVFAFGNKIGWVGSGHLENKIGESEVEVQFLKDGQTFEPSAGELVKCRTFEMKKRALLYQIRIEYTLKLAENRLTEEVVYIPETRTRIGVAYHFMHPWEGKEFSDYLIGFQDGTEKSDAFPAKGADNYLNPSYAALYGQSSGYGIVSALLPSDGDTGSGNEFHLWNRGSDRKFYLVASRTATLPQGARYQRKLVTAFFDADPADWKTKAAALAAQLQKN